MSKRNIYHAAIDADAALNALGRDITDEEINACEVIVQKAYNTLPRSTAEEIDLISAVLIIEGDTLEPAICNVLASIRDGAKKLN